MTASRPSDASLYELALSADPAPQSIQMSPTTFKSMVEILFDFLLEQKIPATLWIKLPKGEVWQSELNEFCQSAQISYPIYLLQSQQDDLEGQPKPRAEQMSTASLPHRQVKPLRPDRESAVLWEGDSADITIIDDLILPATPQKPPSEQAVVHYLPLAAESQLKREYFVLVVAAEFYGLVLAHRPRSSRPRLEATAEAGAKPGGTEDNLERKHPLLGLCSFDANTLQTVLEGINRAIYYGQPVTSSDADLDRLLVTWEQLQEQGWAKTQSPSLMGTVLAKQIQRQEEIWRGSSVDRQRAKQSSEMQQENERMLTTIRLKNEFIQNLGQELRTPLTTMKTALSLLNSPNLKPQQRQRYMEMLSQECDRQSSLITSGLSLIQIELTGEQVPKEPLRLSDVVPGVVSTYQPLAEEKGLRLAYTVPEDLPPISSTLSWLRQIVINLLHNSIKYTPPGGQVWVKARQQHNSIQMEFRDTGIGIAASEIPKIFDRFYRTRHGSDDTGVGLGLTIAQLLVLRSGGSISVKSKPGEGTVFNVLLPIYQESKDDQEG
ncbi:MAG TPA: ATP-binding protein [Trichocoleus sp.]|jgi:signal transduction histidine kinase